MSNPWVEWLLEPFRYVRDRLREEGLPEEIDFDEAHGVETTSWNLTGYQPTLPSVVEAVLDAVGDPRGCTFVDVGAGKGRVVLLASQRPFARALGVERDPAVHAVARRNVEIWRRAHPDRSVDIVRQDALAFAWPAEPLVVFAYNPFGADTFDAFLQGLERSLAAHPRPAWLLYVNPAHHAVVASHGWVEVAADIEHPIQPWRVYFAQLYAGEAKQKEAVPTLDS